MDNVCGHATDIQLHLSLGFDSAFHLFKPLFSRVFSPFSP